MAGGGVKGGISHGETDEIGWKAGRDPVSVHDLHATILHLMGLDHTRLTYLHNEPEGLDRRLRRGPYRNRGVIASSCRRGLYGWVRVTVVGGDAQLGDGAPGLLPRSPSNGGFPNDSGGPAVGDALLAAVGVVGQPRVVQAK